MDRQLEDLIWVAGFFDGEGHIDITTWKGSPYGYLVVSVTQGNAHINVLDFFSVWGGRVFQANKFGWRWQAYANEASNFIKDILPYLKLKRKAAELAIEFQDTMHKKGNTQQLTQEEKQKREALIRKFREIQPARRNKAFLKFR